VTEPAEPLPEGLVEALVDSDAYPADAGARSGVAHVQTHISHVFLTETRVYKLRKAVSPVFLDFTRRAVRNEDCVREVRLNRRLAPDVYLGIAPVEPAGAGFRVGRIAETLRPDGEHVVVMRRLADGRDALALLASGGLERSHLVAAAERIAAFHGEQRLGSPAPFTAAAWLERIDRPMRDNLSELSAHAGLRTEALGEAWRRVFAARTGLLEARRVAGLAVDGHGDLHLAHLWFESRPSEPLFVDCIEFSDDLRRIDAAADVAFLAMDLGYRGHAALAETFLAHYAEATDDYDLYGVVDLYAAYRAAVRAKVAALASDDAAIDPAQRGAAAASCARHVCFAERLLEGGGSGELILIAGSVGTGKSSVARALSDRVPAAVIASDRLRKRRAGLAPESPAPRGAALYETDRIEDTYRALLERAEPALAAGRRVVLDATWSARRHRAGALALAARLGVPAWLVHVDCEEATAETRVAERHRHRRGPSDAGPERVAKSRASFEAPDEWPDRFRLAFSTDAPDWQRRLPALLARLTGG
jgi:aminoglycoside phosphotransferase family enzyme/predicted kinase